MTDTPRVEVWTVEVPPGVKVFFSEHEPDDARILEPAEAASLGRELIAKAFQAALPGTADVDVSVSIDVSNYRPERSAE